jgi:hypothetical protein
MRQTPAQHCTHRSAAAVLLVLDLMCHCIVHVLRADTNSSSATANSKHTLYSSSFAAASRTLSASARKSMQRMCQSLLAGTMSWFQTVICVKLCTACQLRCCVSELLLPCLALPHGFSSSPW